MVPAVPVLNHYMAALFAVRRCIFIRVRYGLDTEDVIVLRCQFQMDIARVEDFHRLAVNRLDCRHNASLVTVLGIR